ncbi:FAD-dependent oxidoreductase [Neobacillus sp. OS1-2]|uniref:FAD-dependent oxidoreductase n=1 Tax=Neobacillus sp. OS1-2 TaxID=3070680 RepID=UPI0027E07355|nr:FAD-dependent oxidoreductase [Neobacillus sp. OS1-2]WML38429.1 FAD-dependent oxidoreductase [Neobacillus sp. OS1-2]
MSGSEHQFPKTFWREIELPTYEPLNEDLSVDVAVVGAGITGITAAYLLSKEGLKVAILEAGGVLNGTTGHTTAKLTAQHGMIYDEFIQHFGPEKARLYFESHMNAIQFVETMVKENGIDCDYSKEDAYIYATTEEYVDKIKTEWEAYKSLNIDGSLKDTIPFNIPAKAALLMRNQAQYHPLKFLKSLLEDAVNAGCSVYENTVATDIEDDDTEPKVVTKAGHRVTCKQVIIASHFPFYDKPGLYFARMHTDRSYAIGIKTDMDYPGGIYISADSPARSIRTTPYNGEKLLILGGENHKTGQGIDTLKHYEALQLFAKEAFGLKEYHYRWSAQDMVTLDKLPFIGKYSEGRENILIATGYKKWGMTTGILAGHLLTDYVMDRENPYMELYSPSRAFQADPDFKSVVTTNADVAKHLIKGKLEYTDKSTDDLQMGEGSVVMYNGKRAGAYKDENGKLYVVDTTCTHLGCECEWNRAEKSWDCPCHGSRYSYSGDVIEGPTKKALELLKEE